MSHAVVVLDGSILPRFTLCAAFSVSYSAFPQISAEQEEEDAAHGTYVDKIKTGRPQLLEK